MQCKYSSFYAFHLFPDFCFNCKFITASFKVTISQEEKSQMDIFTPKDSKKLDLLHQIATWGLSKVMPCNSDHHPGKLTGIGGGSI